MRRILLVALAAIGLGMAMPSAATAQGFYDPNSGQYFRYYTPYSDASGTTFYFPGRNTTTYYGSPYDSMTFVPRGRTPRTYGPGDISSYNPFYRGTDSAPYVTDYTSWYSPYRRTWSWGR